MGLLLLFLAGALQLDSGEQPIMFSFGASHQNCLKGEEKPAAKVQSSFKSQ